MTITQRIRGALMSAESFIAAELAVRERSYLPNLTPAEAEDIADAEENLALIRAAMADCETDADLELERFHNTCENGLKEKLFAAEQDRDLWRKRAEFFLSGRITVQALDFAMADKGKKPGVRKLGLPSAEVNT